MESITWSRTFFCRYTPMNESENVNVLEFAETEFFTDQFCAITKKSFVQGNITKYSSGDV